MRSAIRWLTADARLRHWLCFHSRRRPLILGNACDLCLGYGRCCWRHSWLALGCLWSPKYLWLERFWWLFWNLRTLRRSSYHCFGCSRRTCRRFLTIVGPCEYLDRCGLLGIVQGAIRGHGAAAESVAV